MRLRGGMNKAGGILLPRSFKEICVRLTGAILEVGTVGEPPSEEGDMHLRSSAANTLAQAFFSSTDDAIKYSTLGKTERVRN